MVKWVAATAVLLGLLALGDVALAQSGCPPAARVSVDGPLCPTSQAVTGQVAGTTCGDAAVTIRHTATCDGINDLLVGAGRTAANGAFTIPLSETLHSVHMGCSAPALALINVDVECSCGPLRAEKDVSPLPRFFVPLYIPVPQAGQTTLSGQWDTYCAGATLTVTDRRGNVIGTGILRADGSFVIQLLRPLETNEMVFFTAVGGTCGCSILLASIGPISVPEPSTLLLFASGLAGLAGVVRARRRRRFVQR
jgi:hypothetical protein